MQELHIKRDYNTDIKFNGKLVAAAYTMGKELNLYLSESNLYISEYKDNERREAEICKSTEEIIKFFGYDDTAKALYANADIKYWIDA